ncbi:hypothetical protein [Niveibacterium sp. COAC-50]|uniref:hypothetical protein n=1 Tax=Niveibacterium sp. COAC-50 TaxID=2729384 RepID=UPI00155778A8|nr:hypothetical protein [Niveibacterium sp. COAC-50]
MATLLYGRDLVPLVIIAASVVMWSRRDTRFVWIFVALYILCIHVAIGLLFTSGVVQVLFGLKILSSVFVGLFIGCVANDTALLGWRTAYLLLLVSVVGIFVNYFVAYPWGGGEFSSAFGTVAMAKDWAMDGVRRLAGFARASYDAASVVGALMIVVLSYCNRFYLKSFAAALSLAAIFMTTTKGAAISGMVVVVVWLTYLLFASALVLRVALLIVAILSLAIPLGTVVLFPSSLSVGKSALLLSSFVERITYMWPMALKNVTESGSLIFGRGVGGIGVPQLFGEWWIHNAADNIFVYGYSVFGMASLVYVLCYVVTIIRSPTKSRHTLFAHLFSIFTFSYGITANVFEQPVLLSGLAASAILVLANRNRG